MTSILRMETPGKTLIPNKFECLNNRQAKIAYRSITGQNALSLICQVLFNEEFSGYGRRLNPWHYFGSNRH